MGRGAFGTHGGEETECRDEIGRRVHGVKSVNGERKIEDGDVNVRTRTENGESVNEDGDVKRFLSMIEAHLCSTKITKLSRIDDRVSSS